MAEAPARSPSSKQSATISAESPQSPAHQITESRQFIQVDPNLRDNDADSAVSTSLCSTESLTESIYEYRILLGRTYNAPKTSEYWAPNDNQQNEGLDLLHHCLLMILDDKLFLAPIGDNPQRVLDIGTGTGVWAMDFGDIYPSAEVIGTDLSPIQPAWAPPNVHFQIDDCLLDWTWPENHFDFVHIRMLYGSVPDWEQLYRRAYKHLKPGGWLQDLEMEVRIQSDYHNFPEGHVFNECARFQYEGGDRMGQTFAIACGHTMKDTMQAAGFVDITEVKLKTPCHSWPKDPRLKQAGLLCFAMLDQSLEGFTMYLFTQVLGWTPAEVLIFTARMRAEVKKKSNCGWLSTTVVFGRKPETAEV